MPNFVFKLDIPGACSTTEDLTCGSIELHAKYNELGAVIQLNHSYMIHAKIYCVFTALNEDFIGLAEERAR